MMKICTHWQNDSSCRSFCRTCHMLCTVAIGAVYHNNDSLSWIVGCCETLFFGTPDLSVSLKLTLPMLRTSLEEYIFHLQILLASASKQMSIALLSFRLRLGIKKNIELITLCCVSIFFQRSRIF